MPPLQVSRSVDAASLVDDEDRHFADELETGPSERVLEQSLEDELGLLTTVAFHAVDEPDRATRAHARFAGASPASLSTFTATGASPMQRMLALAEVAPAGVFVAPTFDVSRPSASFGDAARSGEAGSLRAA